MRENKMKIRKLDQSEHGKTRGLWEQVFSEDSQEFVDYYYYIKTKDNTIYVIEEDDEIRAMLQLNPYQVKLQESVVPSDISWELPRRQNIEAEDILEIF